MELMRGHKPVKREEKREEREKREKWVVVRDTTGGGNRIYHRF
jgi:hypothetical protein